MSYKQAVKFSHNHRKDRFFQPIVLGSFQEKPDTHDCRFVPHYRTVRDFTLGNAPDYYMCSNLKCGAKQGR